MTPAQLSKWFTQLSLDILHNFSPLEICKFEALNDFNSAFLNRFACGIVSYTCKIGRRYMNLFNAFSYSMDNMRTPLSTLTFLLWINKNGCMPNRGIIIG